MEGLLDCFISFAMTRTQRNVIARVAKQSDDDSIRRLVHSAFFIRQHLAAKLRVGDQEKSSLQLAWGMRIERNCRGEREKRFMKRTMGSCYPLGVNSSTPAFAPGRRRIYRSAVTWQRNSLACPPFFGFLFIHRVHNIIRKRGRFILIDPDFFWMAGYG